MSSTGRLHSQEPTEFKAWVRSRLLGAMVYGRTDLHPAVAMQQFHDELGEDRQGELKRVLHILLVEWRRRDGWELLEALALVSSYLRLSDSGVLFAKLCRRHKLHRTDRLASFATADTVVCSLAGIFSADTSKLIILESLYHDPLLDARLAAPLFLSLCQTEPDSFDRWFRRYRQLEERARGHIAHDYITLRLLEVMTPAGLHRVWESLPIESRISLVRRIHDLQDPRFGIVFADGELDLVWQEGRFSQRLPLKVPDESAFQFMDSIYSPILSETARESEEDIRKLVSV